MVAMCQTGQKMNLAELILAIQWVRSISNLDNLPKCMEVYPYFLCFFFFLAEMSQALEQDGTTAAAETKDQGK